MSRRLATVLRVTALQEKVARGAAGGTLAAQERARLAHLDAVAAVASAGALQTGTGAELAEAADGRALRALAAVAARGDLRTAQGERQAALARWNEAQRRKRLFEELQARTLEAERAKAEKVAQALADDLSAARARAGK